MMLVSVDSKHHAIKLVSFLRDTWVYIPSLEHEQRLNAACSDGGYKNVVETIEYNFGVKIDGYVVTDFEMFKVLLTVSAVLMSTLRKRKLKKLQTILSDTAMLRLRQVIISLRASKRLLIAE